MAREESDPQVGSGYAFGQLAKALAAAAEHPDASTRERAHGRVERWSAVLRGMASGHLTIGSRTPVADLPAWVTPEVVRGGFATGAAAAGGPIAPHERVWAERAGLEPARSALFAHHLTEPGLAELDALLTSGAYAVDVPEEAALLTAVWLAAAGDGDGALELVETLAPFADRLRFLPRPAEDEAPDPQAVARETVRDAGAALRRRGPNAAVEAMREALTVWNPFADELLAHWLETVRDGRVAAELPAGWTERGAALLDRYRTLAHEHTRCTKHRRPKENLAILRGALEAVVEGHELEPRRQGLLQHAVDAMVRRRGAPASPEHEALRADQARNAAQPAHHAVARVVVARLSALPQLRGVDEVEPLLAPVGSEEAAAAGVPAGTPIPPSVRRVVARALEGTPEQLVEAGVVRSAEVLAELVPRIAATTVAAPYADERLRTLMARNYEAFRRRRTLLLLDLEHQVRIEELPWVRAVAAHRTAGAAAGASTAALARLAELAIEAFPATIMPSPLVTELDTLAREAGLDLPLVEELAADIFMGTFSAKFLRAAQLAGRLLQGTLYERYYGIDYAAVLAIDDLGPPPGGRRKRQGGPRTSQAFDALCFARAGAEPDGWSVAANGTVIEQAQILTTHNLAALTGPSGVGEAMRLDWDSLARRSFAILTTLARRLRNNRRRLPMVKDIAYGWRQLVFFLSRLPPAEQQAFVRWAEEELAPAEEHVVAALRPALNGLDVVVDGGTIAAGAGSGSVRRLLGWTTEQHWMLAALPRG